MEQMIDCPKHDRSSFHNPVGLGRPVKRKALVVAFSPLAALTLLLCPQVVHADSVSGPWRCPPGSYGVPSHAGSYCVTADCDSDEDCGGSDRCVPYRVCSKKTLFRIRRRLPSSPEFYEEEIVTGTCAPSEGCVGGEQQLRLVGKVAPGPATCREGTYCVPPELPPFPPPDQRRGPPPDPFRGAWGIGTSVGVSLAIVLAMVVGIVLVAVVRRRRR